MNSYLIFHFEFRISQPTANAKRFNKKDRHRFTFLSISISIEKNGEKKQLRFGCFFPLVNKSECDYETLEWRERKN